MYRNDRSMDSTEHTGTGRSRSEQAVWSRRASRAAVAATAAAAAAGAFTLLPAGAHAASVPSTTASATTYTFQTLDNAKDPTFNQLLGINSKNVISGYFGSGATGHPNKGYLLKSPYAQANYTNENFPRSMQTQVTALNNDGDTAGFWVNSAGTNIGFVRWNGVYASYTDPNTPKAAGSVNQILGINDSGTAVGFWVNKQGNDRSFELNQATGAFTALHVPGVSWTATGINNNGDIVGFATGSAGRTSSWLMHDGNLVSFQYPGGSDTQAFGVNNSDEIVGTYLDKSGVEHGFVLTDPLGPTSHWQTVDDPNGVGSTVINGINNAGDLVGFYTDSAGNTDGMLATPATKQVYNLTLSPMPQGTVTFGSDSSGNLTVTPDMSGLTPGSSHAVQLVAADGSTVLASFSTLTASSVGQADTTLDSSYTGSIPAGSMLVIRNGTGSGDVAAEPIAETSALSSPGGSAVTLTGVEVGPLGHSYGTPAGQATVTYNPATQTLSVKVNATGVSPGKHAAHVHIGSCASQGAVQYMLTDFTANSQGQIVNQTRTVTGVTEAIPASGWYLNLHQGNSNNILNSSGSPTINFRPLLCSNIG